MTAAILTGLSVLAYAAAVFASAVFGHSIDANRSLTKITATATQITFAIAIILQLTALSL